LEILPDLRAWARRACGVGRRDSPLTDLARKGFNRFMQRPMPEYHQLITQKRTWNDVRREDTILTLLNKILIDMGSVGNHLGCSNNSSSLWPQLFPW